MGKGGGGVGVHEGAGPSQKWTRPMGHVKTMGARLPNTDLGTIAKVPGRVRTRSRAASASRRA